MDKEFVPYEQAQELKSLGFDEECFSFYDSEGELYESEGYYRQGCNVLGEEILAPTFSQAFRFFREKHELVVDWNYSQHDNFGSYIGVCIKNAQLEETIVGVYKTYEEAELACLIKLIEIVKQNNQ
jgi:hypothetical protein